MMRIMQKLFVGVAALFSVVALFSGAAAAEKRIGILLWSEESHYIECKDGILEQLKKQGFGEPTVTFTIENAGGNKAKAMGLAQKFAAAKMDMVIAIGTSATVPVAKEIKDTPVVFSMVYDPVDAKIAEDWKSSGNNTTGASSKVPMSQIVKTLKELAPVKKIAVLYTTGEKNSEAQLKELIGIEADYQVKVVRVSLTTKEEVAQILPEVVSGVDAIFLSGSSIVGDTTPAIVDIATRAKVITVAHLSDRVEKGALLGVCANPRAVGLLAGEKAAKVLNGAKPSSIPIEPLKKLDLIVNMKTVKAGQFRIPPDFMKSVTKVIE